MVAFHFGQLCGGKSQADFYRESMRQDNIKLTGVAALNCISKIRFYILQHVPQTKLHPI